MQKIDLISRFPVINCKNWNNLHIILHGIQYKTIQNMLYRTPMRDVLTLKSFSEMMLVKNH